MAKQGFPTVHVPNHTNWIHEYVPAELLAKLEFHPVVALRRVLEYVQ